MSRNPVVRIEVEGILGIDRLDVQPGALTVIEGSNGVGKTSFLEAVRAVLTEGHDPSLLRRGALKGVVRLTLDDGSVLQKTIAADRSSFEGRHPRVGKVSKARAWVESLVDQLGSDPLALVSCPAAKRAELLAEVMSVEVTDEALAAAAGRPMEDLRVPARALGLDRLEAARKALYDERTGVNRVLKEKRAAAIGLREALPPTLTAAEAPGSIRARRQELQDELDKAVQAAKTELGEQTERDNQVLRAEIEAVRSEAQRRIDSLNEASAKRQRGLNEATTSRVLALQAEARPHLDELTAALATAEAAARESVRAEKTREILVATEEDAARAAAEAESLNAGLAGLDALRVSLMAQLPIRGLEIREGAVLVDGLPFERVNTARQIEIALEVAALRARDVPLLVSDHGEALDPANWTALEEKAAAMGMSLIVARRTDGPLSVRTVPAAERAA